MEKVSKFNGNKRKWTFNVGIIIFGIIFLYLVFQILIYVTESHVTAYEVREGSIVRDTAYTGLAVRSEAVIYTEEGGYINYYATEGSKVGAQTAVYSLSGTRLDFTDTVEEDMGDLTGDEQESILTRAQTFSENYTDAQFGDVYTLRSEVQDTLDNKSNQNKQVQLEEMQEAGVSLTVFDGAADGIILYTLDGFEALEPEDVTPEDVRKTDYTVTNLEKQNIRISAGDPVYKLVTSDDWELVILLDEETAEELADKTSVKVRFSKDGETTNADFEMTEKDGEYMGILSFNSSMVRYVQDRYVDIELIMEDQSGLKIPKSSVVEKDFYTLPDTYLTQGGDSSADGILLESEDGTTEFKAVTVYYQDTESGLIYLDPADFPEGTKVRMPDSDETTSMVEVESLKGVYNINKGYAVFKQITILCESEDYYIVKSGNDYGLSNYDHIALDGSAVRENEVVY